jgi:CRISPR-associated exonuclease Cas4
VAYREEDFLPLSGIQHFAFCRRQWALIHVERQWSENLLTVEGGILHEKAHSAAADRRGDLIAVRGMPIFSATLGFRGECDVVEFHADADGVPLSGRRGTFAPVPVEYKRGKPKEHDADALQVCAQAICLEEMLVCSIPRGFLFYGEPRRRTEVLFDGDLRGRVLRMSAEMHEYFARGYTPRVKPSGACKSCSLADLCVPKMPLSARQYVEESLRCENS